MSQDKIFLLSDIELNEKENSVIKEVIDLHTIPQEKKDGEKNGYPLILIQRLIAEALTYNYYSEQDKGTLKFINTLISTKLRKWVFTKDTFNFMGEVSNLDAPNFINEKYFIIEASSYKEATNIRDEMEADTFKTQHIDVKTFLTAINDMERIHGSTGISPTKLKEIIKGLI